MGINIRVNKELAITSSSTCYVLNEVRVHPNNHKEAPGKEYYIPNYYYPDLRRLCKSMLNKMILNSSCTSFEEVVEHIDKFTALIDEKLKGFDLDLPAEEYR